MSEFFPKSPGGQAFEDIDPIFTMLRSDFPKTLARAGTVETAIRYLQNISQKFSANSSVYQHPDIGEIDPDSLDFFTHTARDYKYWHGLFSMLERSGFSQRNEVLEAVLKQIGTMYREDEQDGIPGQERQAFIALAVSALDDVYPPSLH
jgi:hypothetical protein